MLKSLEGFVGFILRAMQGLPEVVLGRWTLSRQTEEGRRGQKVRRDFSGGIDKTWEVPSLPFSQM